MAKLGRQTGGAGQATNVIQSHTSPAGGAVSMSGLVDFCYKSMNLKMIFKTTFLKSEKLHSIALKPEFSFCLLIKPRLNIQTLDCIKIFKQVTLPAPDIIFHSSALSVHILSLVFMCLRPSDEVCV